MNKLISKIRLALFVILGIQAIIVVTFIVFWFTDSFGIKTVNNIELYLLFVCCGFLLVDSLVFWFSLLKIGRKRQSNDQEAASLIGGDVQNAYNFAHIGLVVVDGDGIVIWANNMFKDMQIDIVDADIYQFAPALKELVNGIPGKTIKVTIKQRLYEVRYLSQPKMFVFNDKTEYEEMATYSREQATVLGIIMIDNYNEVSSDIDEMSEQILKVRSLINDYCHEYGVLIRRIKTDSYFMVCNYNSLARMEKDRFSLVEKVRAAEEKEDVPLTLSIGIAHDFPGWRPSRRFPLWTRARLLRW